MPSTPLLCRLKFRPARFCVWRQHERHSERHVVSEVQEIGQMFLPPLSSAEIVQVASTSVTIDAGIDPQIPGGVEVRRTDAGWGTDNDRNLVGRFTSRTFNVPRLGRVQDFYLRQYDANKRYSRYSAPSFGLSVMRIDHETDERAYEQRESPMFLRVHDSVFQREVLEKLGQLEAKVDMLIGNGQPGRMQNVETRVTVLERNDIRRSVYDRLVECGDHNRHQRRNCVTRSFWLEVTLPRVTKLTTFIFNPHHFNPTIKENNRGSIFRKTVQAIAFVPSVVQGIEELFGSRSGRRKRNRRSLSSRLRCK